MILQWFADMFYKLFNGLLGWIHIPKFTDEQLDPLMQFFDYLESGMQIFRFFIPKTIYMSALVILLAIVGFKYGYYLIMWILKKIPAVGIN